MDSWDFGVLQTGVNLSPTRSTRFDPWAATLVSEP